MNFLEDWHEWLMAQGVQPRIVAAVIVTAVILVAAATAKDRNATTIVWKSAGFALAATALILSLATHTVGWLALVLFAAFVASSYGALMSFDQHKPFRSILGGLAAALTLSAACLVAGGRFTSGDTLSYFIGGSAGSVNWLMSAGVLLVAAPALLWAVVMHFVWGRKAASKPSA
jgi:hypothetical protein